MPRNASQVLSHGVRDSASAARKRPFVSLGLPFRQLGRSQSGSGLVGWGTFWDFPYKARHELGCAPAESAGVGEVFLERVGEIDGACGVRVCRLVTHEGGLA